MNQKVIVIPIENEENLMDTAEGGLHKYANPSIIGLEKDAWREAMVKNMLKNICSVKSVDQKARHNG